MKTSIVLLILIFLNTTAILTETIYAFINGINFWVLLVIELLLIIGYIINKIVKDFGNALLEANFHN